MRSKMAAVCPLHQLTVEVEMSGAIFFALTERFSEQYIANMASIHDSSKNSKGRQLLSCRACTCFPAHSTLEARLTFTA